MGLAFDAIEPVVYPVAYKLFESGMERYRVAGEIFKQFGKRYNVPKDELNTAMIDLSITCAKKDYKKSKKKPKSITQLSPSEIIEMLDDFSEEIHFYFQVDYLDRLEVDPENQPEGSTITITEEMFRNTGDKINDILWELMDKVTEVKRRIKNRNRTK